MTNHRQRFDKKFTGLPILRWASGVSGWYAPAGAAGAGPNFAFPSFPNHNINSKTYFHDITLSCELAERTAHLPAEKKAHQLPEY